MPGTRASRIGGGITRLTTARSGSRSSIQGTNGAIATSPLRKWRRSAICVFQFCHATRSRPATSSRTAMSPPTARRIPARNSAGMIWPATAWEFGRSAFRILARAARSGTRSGCVRCVPRWRGSAIPVAPEGALDPALSTVLRAFQRHWRPETVTGQADDGTVARLLAVAEVTEDDQASRRSG